MKHGEAVYERDSVLFDSIQFSLPVITGLMLAAARNQGKLCVLDFGGALGSSYFQNLKFISKLASHSWNIVEQKQFVEAGNRYFQNDFLKFYHTINDCLKNCIPDAVLLSSVLQYIPNPEEIIEEVTGIGSYIIIIDRTPYTNSLNNKVIRIQSTPKTIYPASYPIQYFVEEPIIKSFAEKGYDLLETYNSLDKLDSNATWKGHIYLKREGL